MNIQIKIKQIILATLIILVFNSCQDFEVPENQGEVKFSINKIELINTADPKSRIEAQSNWKHIFRETTLEINNLETGENYSLWIDFNMGDYFYITLPYGTYSFYSNTGGGAFEEYLPISVNGMFTLDVESLDISSTAFSEYGLITVKNQFVAEAKVSAPNVTTKSLKLLNDKSYHYIYVKEKTSTNLQITENVNFRTFNRQIQMVASKHFNYILDLKFGETYFSLYPYPFSFEEEIIN